MSKENMAYKYRIMPTLDQSIKIEQTFGCCRKVWNLSLDSMQKQYKETGSSVAPGYATFKEEYPFLSDVDSLALANEWTHIRSAFNNFFAKRARYPKFKSRHKDRPSYTTSALYGNIRIEDNKLRLPKIGFVRIVLHRSAPDSYKLKSVTVSRDPDGKYYASVLYEYESDVSYIKSDNDQHVGLDYKSNGLYVASDGTCANMPHSFRQAERKLAKAQRRLSRMKRGSKNYIKQKQKVAIIHKKISNRRKDFLHKESAYLTDRYEIIAIENLDMKAMSNRGFHNGKATMDNGYGMFVNMLEYKQKRKGHLLVRVGKFYPSSQLCHHCGYKNPITKDLSVRKVICPVCGEAYDRDINAAINIDNEGMRLAMSA